MHAIAAVVAAALLSSVIIIVAQSSLSRLNPHTPCKVVAGASYVSAERPQKAPLPTSIIVAPVSQQAQSSSSQRPPGAMRRRQKAAPGKYVRLNQEIVNSTLVRFKGFELSVVALTNDEFVGKQILARSQPYNGRVLSRFLEFVQPGTTVVDAGANMGSYSVFFAAKVGPKGRVIAFEPQLRMYQLLCTNLMINGLLHLQAINSALSYEPGVLQMQATITDGRSRGKPLTETEREHETINYGGMRLGVGGEEVQARTLDSFNLTGVSFIKVDVQWAEKLMFYGARETIRRNLPVVAYEFADLSIADALAHDLRIPEDVRTFNISAFLEDLGYRTSALSGPRDHIMVPPGYQEGND